MDIVAYDQREKHLDLMEKLVEIEALSNACVSDIPARTASENLHTRLRERVDV